MPTYNLMLLPLHSRWRTIKLIGLTLLLGQSCHPKTDQTPLTSANQQLIRKYFALFNQHQWSAMAALYTDTAGFKDPSLGPGLIKQSRQQTITKYTQLSKLFPDIQDEVIRLYPSGDKHVIVEFVSRGTGPDRSRFTLPICTIFTIEKGKIVGDFTYYDNVEDPESDSESSSIQDTRP